MMRRLSAVGLLSMASIVFASRFVPPAETAAELEEVIASIEIEVPETTYPSYAPVPSVVTTTIPPLPPGIQKFQSGFVRISGRGVLQLEITLELGVLTDIEMIRVPSSSNRAKETNLETHPLLRTEALDLQHYRVHVVSGATETTYAWARALRDALEHANFCVIDKCDLPIE